MTLAPYGSAHRLISAGADQAEVACAGCGERYMLVDRWLQDYPPGPRGHPDSWLEVYQLPFCGDPDDRVMECRACGEWLDPTDPEALVA